MKNIQQKPLRFAHRGILLYEPENTLTSFNRALELGVQAIEVDVVSTSDGVVVCSHNFDLERKTDSYGYIDQLKYEEVMGVHILGPNNKTEKICTLERILHNIDKSNWINIEIKTRTLFDIRTAFHVASLLKNTDRKKNTIVSSFNPLLLWVFKALCKNVKTGWIVKHKELLPLLFLSRADHLHARGDIVSQEFLRTYKTKNINVWTVNTQPAIQWLKQQNVSGIITDRLEYYTQ